MRNNNANKGTNTMTNSNKINRVLNGFYRHGANLQSEIGAIEIVINSPLTTRSQYIKLFPILTMFRDKLKSDKQYDEYQSNWESLESDDSHIELYSE